VASTENGDSTRISMMRSLVLPNKIGNAGATKTFIRILEGSRQLAIVSGHGKIIVHGQRS
jgi:hypothetical protein